MTSSARVACLRRRAPAGERGVILIWALISVFTVGALVAAATTDLKSLTTVSDAQFSGEGQAQAVAEAGLADAYAWFRAQKVQPVSTFAPVLNLAASPPINETDDPTIGLVREYELTPGLWARYEVMKGVPAESFTDANANGIRDPNEAYVDTNHDGKWNPAHGTRDVTAERGVSGTGAVWLLVCRGHVFQRSDDTKPLTQSPNVQLATVERAAEVRRLTLSMPTSAAICCSKGSNLKLQDKSRIRSTVTAVAYPTLTGVPLNLLADLVAPVTTLSLTTTWNDTTEGVFGLAWEDLRAMADVSTSDPESTFPSPVPVNSMIVATGDVTFDANRPLRGSGILVIKGNVSIQSGGHSSFSGMLYVDGDLTVRGPCMLEGTILCRGVVDCKGNAGDYVEIVHDAPLVAAQLTAIGQYRYTKAAYEPLPRLPDGRPDESKTSKTRGYNAP